MSEDDAALPEEEEQEQEQEEALSEASNEQQEEEEEEAEEGSSVRSFGVALASILHDTRKGGITAPPGTLRKRAAEKEKLKESEEARQVKKRLFEKDRVMPEPSAAAYERRLMKVATKGVVRLFNAVAAQRAAHDANQDDEDDRPLQPKAGAC